MGKFKPAIRNGILFIALLSGLAVLTLSATNSPIFQQDQDTLDQVEFTKEDCDRYKQAFKGHNNHESAFSPEIRTLIRETVDSVCKRVGF